MHLNILKKCMIICFSFIFIVIFLTWLSPHCLVLETRGYIAIEFMAQRGIIENNSERISIFENTNYGKNIKKVDDLDNIIKGLNKHSSAHLIEQNPSKNNLLDMISENLPYSYKMNNFTIIRIPSVYSLDYSFYTKYCDTLDNLIKRSREPIVLDLTGNAGGSFAAMVMGANSLIPNGKIFDEIDNKGEEFPLYLNSRKIFGGIDQIYFKRDHYTEEISQYKKTKEKISVLVDERTGSAAEMLTIALKNNHNVKVFGTPTSGFTSVNQFYELPSDSLKDTWLVNYTIGYLKTNNGIIYNNNKIIPDVLLNSTKVSCKNYQMINELSKWANT